MLKHKNIESAAQPVASFCSDKYTVLSLIYNIIQINIP